MCHKSVKNTIFCHHMGSFKLKMHQNQFSAGVLPRTPLGELTTLPKLPSGLGRRFTPPYSPSPRGSTSRSPLASHVIWTPRFVNPGTAPDLVDQRSQCRLG